VVAILKAEVGCLGFRGQGLGFRVSAVAILKAEVGCLGFRV
jgi:hypothetical protein